MTFFPDLNARFRPRADAATLSAVVRDAWQEYAERVRSGISDELREAITAQIEAKHPPSDMAVLARYGHAETVERTGVSVFGHTDGQSYGAWDCRVSIVLTRPVVISRGFRGLSTRPSWHDDPLHGCRAEHWATLSEEERQKIQIEHDRREADAPPREFEPAFQAYRDARDAEREEYRNVTQWPEQHKREAGEWPTWSEIAARFPITGAYLRKLKEAKAEEPA